ncbi:MAG TPA: riboflavin kinase, partial [Nitrospiria bacterium]|nr:riboflavin kinase [Nitrospiria bacterium]
SLQGEVIASTGRGTPMGYPTANFNPPPEQVIPANGIYAVRATLGNREDRLYDGVSYIGTQPTLGAVGRMIETHLFEPQPDLYGETLRVRFLEWVRPEQVFDSQEELLKRIREDVGKARDFLASH